MQMAANAEAPFASWVTAGVSLVKRLVTAPWLKKNVPHRKIVPRWWPHLLAALLLTQLAWPTVASGANPRVAITDGGLQPG